MKCFNKFLKNDPLKIILGLCLFLPGLMLNYFELSVSVVFFILSLAVSGISVYVSAFRGILRRDFLDEKFLMCLAATGAMIIGEYAEGAAVMLFFLVGEYFEHRAVGKSRKTIKALLDICPDSASVIVDGVETEYDAEDVPVGAVIVLRPGDRVPLDCRVIKGSADIDTSMFTGESLPLSVDVGDDISSGCVVMGGTLHCECVRVAEQSCAARIIELVENATERKAKEEKFITVFSRYYTPIVTFLAVVMAVVPSVFGWLDFSDALYRALSFLVVSCPCALVISVPLAFFGGIGGAAHNGILYKGGSVFSPLGKAEVAVFDKTGTLTGGKFKVSSVSALGVSDDELLRLVASAEQGSNHPIAECLRRASNDLYEIYDFTEISGKGVCASVNGSRVCVGNLSFIRECVSFEPKEDLPGRIYVSRDGKYIGFVTVSDEVKPEAVKALRALKSLGIKKTVMLTGDKSYSGKAVGEKLGIDEVYTDMLPADKFQKLENIIESTKGGVVYVGDGINDAPCLRRADVGIAMGAIGSDSAIETADIVIMNDNLNSVTSSISVANKIYKTSIFNIVFSLTFKLVIY